jgi:hypothetical protein
MPNYKEATASSTSWQRAYQVTINNKLGEVPYITFYEEEAVALDSGQHLSKHIGQIQEHFYNPMTEFNMLNPETGEVIGTATYMQAYLIMHSMYMHLANLRDNPPADPIPEDPPIDPPPEEPPV